jgi:hypothetical protein
MTRKTTVAMTRKTTVAMTRKTTVVMTRKTTVVMTRKTTVVMTRKTRVVMAMTRQTTVVPMTRWMARQTVLSDEQQTKFSIKHVQTKSVKHIFMLLNKCTYYTYL